MGSNATNAQAAAREWWNSASAARSRSRGYAICDRCEREIPSGTGCLCMPVKVGDSTPDLVCESCFERLPYVPFRPGEGPRCISAQCPKCGFSYPDLPAPPGATSFKCLRCGGRVPLTRTPSPGPRSAGEDREPLRLSLPIDRGLLLAALVGWILAWLLGLEDGWLIAWLVRPLAAVSCALLGIRYTAMGLIYTGMAGTVARSNRTLFFGGMLLALIFAYLGGMYLSGPWLWAVAIAGLYRVGVFLTT